jgi:hypothetical protein
MKPSVMAAGGMIQHKNTRCRRQVSFPYQEIEEARSTTVQKLVTRSKESQHNAVLEWPLGLSSIK